MLFRAAFFIEVPNYENKGLLTICMLLVPPHFKDLVAALSSLIVFILTFIEALSLTHFVSDSLDYPCFIKIITYQK